ncbi:NADH kinase pos5 [Coemansia sp. Benny D115]|nr:NADH kinase pos5 [Coemansia sp. Benny D115]
MSLLLALRVARASLWRQTPAASAATSVLRARLQQQRFGLSTTADIPTKTEPVIYRQGPDSQTKNEGTGDSTGDADLDGGASPQLLLQWHGATPKTVLIVRKANDVQVDSALVRIAQWLHREYPQINVVLEPCVYRAHRKELPFVVTVPESGAEDEYGRVVDFVVTLGGDGTFLHVSSLFSARVPPIIPFSMGTLGFLLPFNVSDFAVQLRRVIEGTATLLPRMRLVYTRGGRSGDQDHRDRPSLSDGGALQHRVHHITNEASIHRGTYPHLTTISCFLDGHLLTTSVGDGIIVATPTGSTAYALSAGGPIVHPLVSSMVLAPVCPRSLSFRPLMLPPTSVVTLQVHHASRGHATAYVDGRDCGVLAQGECVEIRRSPYPLLCVNRDDLACGWAQDINQLLKFNRTFSHPHETPFGE